MVGCKTPETQPPPYPLFLAVYLWSKPLYGWLAWQYGTVVGFIKLGVVPLRPASFQACPCDRRHYNAISSAPASISISGASIVTLGGFRLGTYRLVPDGVFSADGIGYADEHGSSHTPLGRCVIPKHQKYGFPGRLPANVALERLQLRTQQHNGSRGRHNWLVDFPGTPGLEIRTNQVA